MPTVGENYLPLHEMSTDSKRTTCLPPPYGGGGVKMTRYLPYQCGLITLERRRRVRLMVELIALTSKDFASHSVRRIEWR